MLVGYCSRYGSIPDQFPVTSLADFADDVTVVQFNFRRAQWVKDRMKLLAMVTNQHFAMSDSHALLMQHVVERCSAEITVVKELRLKMLGQHPGYFKAVFLKKTQIIIVSIYEYTVYIMF